MKKLFFSLVIFVFVLSGCQYSKLDGIEKIPEAEGDQCNIVDIDGESVIVTPNN